MTARTTTAPLPRCADCGRELRDEISQTRGVGPVCWGYRLAAARAAGLPVTEARGLYTAADVARIFRVPQRLLGPRSRPVVTVRTPVLEMPGQDPLFPPIEQGPANDDV